MSDNCDISQQLDILETSQGFILLIIGAILLSYYATTVQRKQLLCAAGCPVPDCRCLPDTFWMSVASAFAVLAATGYFYILSEQQLCAPHETCVQCRSAEFSRLASLLVLIAALIRLLNLFFIRSGL